MDNYLKSQYYDVAKPGSYSGVVKFWQSVKRDGNPLKLKYGQVKGWLLKQQPYALHKPSKENFKRESIIVGEINEIWDADLMDMQKFGSKNKGYRYLAIFIDLFSRFLRVEPMKNKTSQEMLRVMQKVLDKVEVKTLRTDQGKEYTANIVQEYLKSKGINHIIAYNVYHANYAERVIRTLKGRLYRFFTKKQTHKYIDDLDSIIDSYNNTKHSSIQMAPAQVTPDNQQELYEKLYLPAELKRERKRPVFQFGIGDKVRVSYARKPFKRGYQQNWSDEIFLVDKRIGSLPPRYRLVDLQLEPIKGSFYAQELQDAHDDGLYKVEKVLRYRTKEGKRQALVTWLNYPSKFDSWIDADQLQDYE